MSQENTPAPYRPVTTAAIGTPCGWTAFGETGTWLACQADRPAVHVLTETLPIAPAGTALCAFHSPFDPTAAERAAIQPAPEADGSEFAALLGGRLVTDQAEIMARNDARKLRMARKFLAAYARWVEVSMQDGSRRAMAYGWGIDFAATIGHAAPTSDHTLLILKGKARDIVDQA